MPLITDEDRCLLNKQWKDQSGKLSPALKLFTPAGAATWLIHSVDPEEPDHLFGLCDLGLGFAELGYVSLAELEDLEVPVKVNIFGRTYTYPLKVEKDLYFKPAHSLATYALAASHRGAITEDTASLKQAETQLATVK